MPRFAQDIERFVDGFNDPDLDRENEVIQYCVIGSRGRNYQEDALRDAKIDLIVDEAISWGQARPLLNYEYERTSKARSCHAVYVWTQNYVVSISHYNQLTQFNFFPRRPVDCPPFVPGDE